MMSLNARLANQCRCVYYLAGSLSDLLSVYSKEGRSIVIKMSVEDLLRSWLVGIEETVIAMSDCQPRIPLRYNIIRTLN